MRKSPFVFWGSNMEIQFTYSPATPEKLTQIWNQNIAANPGDDRWVQWKDQLIAENAAGISKTFLVLADDRPVGEGTLLLSKDCGAAAGRSVIAEAEKNANINGLRIEKSYEGQGHISRLVQMMETWTKAQGFTTMTIGVEAKETRNLAIYLHWGYTKFLMSEVDGSELVLYYGKTL